MRCLPALLLLRLAAALRLSTCDPAFPTFSLRAEGWDFRLKPEVADYWRSVRDTLATHPCRVQGIAAPLTFIGTIAATLHELSTLPRHTCGAYVVLSHGLQLDHCAARWDEHCRLAQLALARNDVLHVALDLRDHTLLRDDGPPLPGVTFAPPRFYNGQRGPQRWLLSYRGVLRSGWYGSSDARPRLEAAFRSGTDARVAMEFLPLGHELSHADMERYKELLEGSAFALVPHGDGRWSYRLAEAIGACAVPVVMADGATLPYEEIIDWSRAAIRVSESLASYPELLLAQLPQDPRVIESMQNEVCGIRSKYFDTMEKRVDALLMSLGAHLMPAWYRRNAGCS